MRLEDAQKTVARFRDNVKKYRDFSIKYDYAGPPPKFFKDPMFFEHTAVWLFDNDRFRWPEFISFAEHIRKILRLQSSFPIFSNEDYIQGNIYVTSSGGRIHWAVPNEFSSVIKLIEDTKPTWAKRLDEKQRAKVPTKKR